MKALAGCLVALALPAAAAEMQVHGEVLEVIPLSGGAAPAGASADCDLPRPAAGAGLAELLAWDLRLGCPPATPTPVSGYRVHYRWDGRTYTLVTREPPGATVPLRVRLD